jgi:uncharacterized membrane protein YbhN (UPF0104 family)
VFIRKAGKIALSGVAISIFVASVLYLAVKFQWREALSYLARVNFIRLVILIWMTQFVYIVVRAWRWRAAVRHANPEIRFFDLYWITAVVVSLAILTPAQSGEALKIELLKRRGLLDRLPGLGAFGLERALDLLTISSIGALGVAFGGFAKQYRGVGWGASALMALALMALYVLLHFDPGGRVSHWLSSIRAGGGTPSTRAMMAAATILCWTLTGVSWQIALLAVDIHLSLPEILSLLSLVTLGALLSWIPGGLGVSEVLTAGALVSMGIAPVAAQAGALILRAQALIIVLFGLVHLLLWPLMRIPLRVRRHDRAN